MDTKHLFLSCDWGTSSFRLRLVEVPELRVVAEVSNNNGIAASYELWKQSGLPESERLSFYQNIIAEGISNLQRQTNRPLPGIPIVLSGMASSTIGMIELPYKELPFLINGSDLGVHAIQPSPGFMHELIIVSGVRSDDDVMRGEEVQLVGSFSKEQQGQQLFILPGTHSKRITVEDNRVVDFQTFMTGEVFSLLSTKSILSASVEQGSAFDSGNNKESFIKGVNDSTIMNPLHAFFLVRTNALFKRMTKHENFYYLSGLLIGTELKDVSQKDYKITLVSNDVLQPYYELALQQLGFKHPVLIIDVDEAMIRGHYKIYRNHFHRG